MEEQVKTENVVVEVEEKKKFFTKKRIWAIGGTVVALGLGALALMMRDKDHESEGEEIVNILDTAYEPVSNDSEVGE